MRKTLTTKEFREKISSLVEEHSKLVFHHLSQRVWDLPPLHEFPWLATELEKFSGDLTSYRLAFLSTFTLEPIHDIVRAFSLAHHLDTEIYFSGFQQLEQEVISPDSGLKSFDPECIVFAWMLQDISPRLWHSYLELSENEIQTEIDNIDSRLNMLIESTNVNYPQSHILLHTFVAPTYPALGTIDYQHSHGCRQLIENLNSRLLQLANETEGVYLVDCQGLAQKSGSEWHDARYWYSARAPLGPRGQTLLSKEYASYIRAFSGKTKKVLVTDLDNTLWGGILGEDGLDGIKLGSNFPGNTYVDFQKEIKQLSKRGVILAINSKNNESDVREAFEEHPHMALKWDDFAATRVNWQDKASNMKELAADLSVGLDSFVFIDDNPSELELVKQSLPEVTVVLAPSDQSQLPGLLSSLGLFDNVIYSEEDRKRGKYYRSQVKRTKLKNTSGDLDYFYRSLEMKLTICTVNKENISRVAQLTQRTNQFNMTTRRYSESEITQLCNSSSHLMFNYKLEDRFGDNGIVSTVIVEKQGNVWRIDTFIMSCRVIGRKLETAILALLIKEAADTDVATITADFIPTKKNMPAKSVYSDHGFELIEETADNHSYKLDLDKSNIEIPEFFMTTTQSI